MSIDASLTPFTYSDAVSKVHKRRATFFMGFPDDGVAEDAEADDFDADCRSSFATWSVFRVSCEGGGEVVGQAEVANGVTVGLESIERSFGLGDGVRVTDIRVTIASEKVYKTEDRSSHVIIVEVFCNGSIFSKSLEIDFG